MEQGAVEEIWKTLGETEGVSTPEISEIGEKART